jgi:nucleoside-diphosphate-sugar epimerase
MDTTDASVAVVGGTGFVGTAVVQALRDGGANVIAIAGPRLAIDRTLAREGRLPREAFLQEVAQLRESLVGVDIVVNAAGDPNASSAQPDELLGPNAALPVVVQRACVEAGVSRFIHVSSSVVQGDRPTLDSDAAVQPFSHYSFSKALGEKWVRAEGESDLEVVIYRPPSVHAPGRGVTEKIRSVARSPLSTVAGAGDRPTPQALLENVADGIRFLAVCPERPPTIVHHPWEGLTSADLLLLLGGRPPRHIPPALARTLVGTAKTVEILAPPLAPNRRRVELLWLGQVVAPSWLTSAGWSPVAGRDAWRSLGAS